MRLKAGRPVANTDASHYNPNRAIVRTYRNEPRSVLALALTLIDHAVKEVPYEALGADFTEITGYINE
jgi:hypothetical protein